MPGAKAASTGRTDGPLLQKPVPQSVQLFYKQMHKFAVLQSVNIVFA